VAYLQGRSAAPKPMGWKQQIPGSNQLTSPESMVRRDIPEWISLRYFVNQLGSFSDISQNDLDLSPVKFDLFFR